MPKRRSDVALTSPETETKAKKAYSNAALTARKLSRLEKQQLIDKAAAWCIENECDSSVAPRPQPLSESSRTRSLNAGCGHVLQHLGYTPEEAAPAALMQ